MTDERYLSRGALLQLLREAEEALALAKAQIDGDSTLIAQLRERVETAEARWEENEATIVKLMREAQSLRERAEKAQNNEAEATFQIQELRERAEKTEALMWERHINPLKAENEQLRAQVEQGTEQWRTAEVLRLEAENKRLRDRVTYLEHVLKQDGGWDDVHAENERLRVALGQVEVCGDRAAVLIARQALEEGGEDVDPD